MLRRINRGLLLVVVLGGLLSLAACAASPTATAGVPAAPTNNETKTYSSVPIDNSDFKNAHPMLMLSLQPDAFVKCVDNPFFPMIPGTVYHHEEQSDKGLLSVTVAVMKDTKEIMGIQTTVVHDSVMLGDELIEDTLDWYAQDDRGNVWYLGEDTKEYENGQVSSTKGTWQAGVNGAIPGFAMLAQPRPGDLYYQEYFKGEAEDMGAIMSLTESVKVTYGSFDHVLQTADYLPLDDKMENKWYARGIGVVKEIDPSDGTTGQLVSISHDDAQMATDRGCGANGGVSAVGTQAP